MHKQSSNQAIMPAISADAKGIDAMRRYDALLIGGFYAHYLSKVIVNYKGF